MLGLQGEGLLEIRPPVFQRLVGEAIDEVQRDGVKSRIESLFDGALRLRWRMLPAEKLQVLAAEGLHTEADEIETEGPPGRKFLGLYIIGIDLQAHAGALSQFESASHTLDDGPDAFER